MTERDRGCAARTTAGKMPARPVDRTRCAARCGGWTTEKPMAAPETPQARRGTWTAKKPDGGDGRGAGAINRSTSPPIGAASGSGCQSCALAFRLRPLQAAWPPYVRNSLRHNGLYAGAGWKTGHDGCAATGRGAIHCALMGYIQGWGRKRGTTNALHPTAQSAPHGALFMGARASRSQACGQDARAPSLTNSLRLRLRRAVGFCASRENPAGVCKTIARFRAGRLPVQCWLASPGRAGGRHRAACAACRPVCWCQSAVCRESR